MSSVKNSFRFRDRFKDSFNAFSFSMKDDDGRERLFHGLTAKALCYRLSTLDDCRAIQAGG